MAIAFTRFSHWLLGAPQPQPHRTRTRTRTRKPKAKAKPKGAKESEAVKLNFSPPTPTPPSRPRGRRDPIDQDHDMLLVPSDGAGCLSGSDSDASDWSIGWLEPHPPDFWDSDDAPSEDSFAVLVPCYGPRRADPSSNARAAFGFRMRAPIPQDGLPLSESNEFLQQWLSSLPSELHL